MTKYDARESGSFRKRKIHEEEGDMPSSKEENQYPLLEVSMNVLGVRCQAWAEEGWQLTSQQHYYY